MKKPTKKLSLRGETVTLLTGLANVHGGSGSTYTSQSSETVSSEATGCRLSVWCGYTTGGPAGTQVNCTTP